MTTKKKMTEKKLVLTIEVEVELKYLDALSAISDGIETLRGTGSAEIVDARVEEE